MENMSLGGLQSKNLGTHLNQHGHIILKIIVDRKKIEPYNQIGKIKYNQSIKIDTKIVKEMNFLDEAKEELVIYIGVDDEIPYELWENRIQ